MALGTQNIVRFVTFLGRAGTVGASILSDGKIGLSDLVYLRELLAIGADFCSIDFKAAWPELKDLDDMEKAQLATSLKEHLKITGGSIDEIVTNGFVVVLDALNAITHLMAFIERLKGAAK